MPTLDSAIICLGPALCLTPQPFDSGFLGGPVYRLSTDPRLDRAGIRTVQHWARANAAALVSARVLPTLGAAFAGSRFRKVETLVTFERPLDDAPDGSPDSIRIAGPDDAEACAAIAAASFTDDRFHIDPATAHAADAMKAAWARNDVNGRADTCFVAVSEDNVCGFNLCLFDGAVATIDLIATAPAWQGRGFGRALVRAALAHYHARAEVMRVGTQATNAASLALYPSEGFSEIGRADTYHLTPEPEAVR